MNENQPPMEMMGSSNELFKNEARKALDELAKCIRQPELLAGNTDIREMLNGDRPEKPGDDLLASILDTDQKFLQDLGLYIEGVLHNPGANATKLLADEIDILTGGQARIDHNKAMTRALINGEDPDLVPTNQSKREHVRDLVTTSLEKYFTNAGLESPYQVAVKKRSDRGR